MPCCPLRNVTLQQWRYICQRYINISVICWSPPPHFSYDTSRGLWGSRREKETKQLQFVSYMAVPAKGKRREKGME